jgi:diadenosine tetraphosphate (Ap4A) HIT family hydrolase
MSDGSAAGCFVCRKHRKQGALVPGGPVAGLWCARASRALQEVAGAEHVYAAVFGDGVPHLHVHLLPRFPGTPREYWGTHVNKWPEARRGDAPEIEALVQELRGYLAE